MKEEVEIQGCFGQWTIIGKVTSQGEGGFVKKMFAQEIPGAGCLVHITTEMCNKFAESTTWVPGVEICTGDDGQPSLKKATPLTDALRERLGLTLEEVEQMLNDEEK